MRGFVMGYYDKGIFVFGNKKSGIVPLKTIDAAVRIVDEEFNDGQHVNIYELVKVKTVKATRHKV